MVWSCPPRNFAFSNCYLPGISGIEGAFYEPGSKTVIPRKVCKFEALFIKRWRTTIITGKERQFKFGLLPPPLIFWRGKRSARWGWWEDSLPLPFVQWLMTSWRSWRSLPIICDMAKVSLFSMWLVLLFRWLASSPSVWCLIWRQKRWTRLCATTSRNFMSKEEVQTHCRKLATLFNCLKECYFSRRLYASFRGQPRKQGKGPWSRSVPCFKHTLSFKLEH